MINNIFNQFDPHNFLLNPFIILIFILLIINPPLLNPNLNNIFLTNILTNIINENNINISPNNNNSSNPALTNIIIFISIINILALIPYSWSNTSHLAFNLTLICLTWTPLLLVILANNNNNFLTHLIPQNTPNLLIPFIFLIEIISFFIRPITLTIRLTANIIAGHIIISLNSNIVLNSSLILILPSVSIILLTIIEIIVAILQAYIIITLISIFISEI